MTHRLNEVINSLRKELSNERLAIMDNLSERFVNGSPDQVLMAIENQMNHILDERDELLINALEEITEYYTDALQQTIKNLEGKFTTFCKSECLPNNNRRGVS